MKPFRYSGNKSRLVPYYRRPPPDTKRVVELYLGSGAYSMSCDLPCLGYELNADVVAMWKWLQTTNAAELQDLDDLVESTKKTHEKADVRSLKLERGPETYVRVNVSGVYTGQLGSWVIYPQHKLPIKNTILSLSRIRDIEVIHGSASEYSSTDGDLVFVDPPYVGTYAGYTEKRKAVSSLEKTYDPKETSTIIQGLTRPTIFTYGDGASSLFPQYEWQHVLTRKVPNIRRGGTVDRSEWVAYINW